MASYLHTPATMIGRWLVGAVAVGALTMACTNVPPVKKKSAAACDPNTTDCSALGSGAKKPHDDGTLKTTTGSPLAAPDDAASEAKKARDAKAAAENKDNDTPTTGDAPVEKPTTPTDTVPLPTPRPADADPPASSSSSSSGSTDPLAGVGPKCTKLWACCYNLRQAGITGSANQCDDTALGNDELTCDIANENYKTPDDNYDPVCD